MKEAILHYIWKHQYFNQHELKTVDGRSIRIISPGIHNTDQGPDFSHARIFIDAIEWVGNIEIHVNSSDWDVHNHSLHGGYDSVILHVVYLHNKEIFRPDGTPIPVLDLRNFVDTKVVASCIQLMESEHTVPCQPVFHLSTTTTRLGILDRMAINRLERKSLLVLQKLEANNFDWEETVYQQLASNFGFKTNSETFRKLAENLPYKIISRHIHSLVQLEALLFGIAGFLSSDSHDPYLITIKKEYQFLKHKYQLDNQELKPHEWKFLRLRPANFPTIRLAQFASFLHQNQQFFSKVIEISSVQELKRMANVTQSNYWKLHYVIDKPSASPISGLGASSQHNILINTFCTILAAYSVYKSIDSYMNQAIHLLDSIPAEKNNITGFWESCGVEIKSAFDSQASIELFNEFCSQKKCLSCSIGHQILQQYNYTTNETEKV